MEAMPGRAQKKPNAKTEFVASLTSRSKPATQEEIERPARKANRMRAGDWEAPAAAERRRAGKGRLLRNSIRARSRIHRDGQL
jgi:hypothetical protein